MLEEFTKFTDYHPIRFKKRPLYFANFAHHPQTQLYRQPQNFNPKTDQQSQPRLRQREGRRTRSEGREPRRLGDREQTEAYHLA